MVQGRRRDLGLGGVSWISLAEARERAKAFRKIAREGGDPLAERARARASEITFRQAAKQVHEGLKPSWKNAKHGQQWINTLEAYVFPYFGDTRIDLVGTPEVLRALSPIWLTKSETARRVRQRIGQVLDWAKSAGHRQGDNPVDTVAKGLPRQTDRAEHHRAVAYADAAAFVKLLQNADGNELTRLAFEFLVLTATRTSEVLKATWSEIDETSVLWTIPKGRMKAGVEHRVPLSQRAVAILKRARKLAPEGDLVFPGRRGRPLSNMAFAMTMRRIKVDATPHGFRSTFRDWASEMTAFPHEVAEMALAHTVSNKVEAAYRRSDLLQKRRELMEAWGVYLDAS